MGALKTNFVLVDVDDAEIDVGKLATYNKERHRALEDAHGNDYVFRRRGDSLEAVRTNSMAELLDMAFEKRSVRDIGKLLNALVERGFERYVIKPKIALVRRKPLTIVSLEPKNDVANTLFGRRTQGCFPLHVRRGFRIEARTVYRKAGPAPALVVDAITHSDLGDATCADLISDGFDLRGLYVLSLDPADAKHGRPTMIGQVVRVDGMTVHLGSDRRSERTQYEASALALDLGPAALPRLVAHYVGAEAHEELSDERNLLATGSQRWDRISKFVGRLAEGSFEIAPGVRARLGDWVTGLELGQTTAALPRYIVGGNKEADSTRGLFKSGPVHVPASARNSIRACVICERARRREVEAFLTALSDGEGSHRPLRQTWKLGAVSFTIFEAASSSATDYEKAFQASVDEGSRWQLALVQVPSDTQDAHGDENPYLVTKAKFLARNVPVQEFRVETMKKPTSQRQWALGGIGLQVFAKLGGVPWLLQTKTKEHELILGLGSASLGTSRFGARDRVVGLTTAFSGDGRYYLTETSRTVKYEEHEGAVVESAVAAFKRVRTEMAWRTGDPVRIVLHSFKDLRRKHIDALKSAVLAAAGSELKVDFAFLHLAEQHPILLFDPSEQQQIPPRGAVVQLGRYEALVAVLGPNEIRNDRVGFPRPVCIKLQEGSTFTKLDYLSEQAIAFAALSWRNFTPTSVPITVLYAELIADLLGRLGSLSRWDPDVLRGDVGTSRWFL
ncbi:Piwi domain-containing protein [Sorangium sp. So ce128]|uniref:Piwi domain-containing protein n=1 Tax=Sorangium sp. So ce128 TaxID=3133281 RepID=UPI003F608B2D